MEPFYSTLILFSLHALISKLGYTRAAESIYSSFLITFGRKDNKKFLENWRELKTAKAEVSKTSAQVRINIILFYFLHVSRFQDEFAKWAKLQRKVDKLQTDFDKQCMYIKLHYINYIVLIFFIILC